MQNCEHCEVETMTLPASTSTSSAKATKAASEKTRPGLGERPKRRRHSPPPLPPPPPPRFENHARERPCTDTEQGEAKDPLPNIPEVPDQTQRGECKGTLALSHSKGLSSAGSTGPGPRTSAQEGPRTAHFISAWATLEHLVQLV